MNRAQVAPFVTRALVERRPHSAGCASTPQDGTCKLAGHDLRLMVVARPGAYDPDVEFRVAGDAPGAEAGLPRGKVWTLKSMVRNRGLPARRRGPGPRSGGDMKAGDTPSSL